MEAEIMLGKYSVSFILTILLAWCFGLVTDDPATISNRVKKAIAVLAGIGLSVLAMFYQISTGTLLLTLPNTVDYVISGFLIGAASIGINQLMKSDAKKP
jgi:heme A synthase